MKLKREDFGKNHDFTIKNGKIVMELKNDHKELNLTYNYIFRGY